MTIDEIGIREIVPGDLGGGANTSHTIVVPAVGFVLEAVPADAQHLAYREKVPSLHAAA